MGITSPNKQNDLFIGPITLERNLPIFEWDVSSCLTAHFQIVSSHMILGWDLRYLILNIINLTHSTYGMP